MPWYLTFAISSALGIAACLVVDEGGTRLGLFSHTGFDLANFLVWVGVYFVVFKLTRRALERWKPTDARN